MRHYDFKVRALKNGLYIITGGVEFVIKVRVAPSCSLTLSCTSTFHYELKQQEGILSDAASSTLDFPAS